MHGGRQVRRENERRVGKQAFTVGSAHLRTINGIPDAPVSGIRSNRKTTNAARDESQPTETAPALSSQVTTSILACPICKESHQLYKCERFRKMPVRDRVSEARKKGLCLNCLRSTNHFAIECNASRCKVCNRKHNTLLHTQSEPSQGSTAVANERGESDSEAAVANIGRGLKAASHREALLLTAKVKLLDVNGKPITVRALLDSGSQVNIITRNLAQRLRLQSKEFRAPIAGIGQMTTQPLHQMEVSGPRVLRKCEYRRVIGNRGLSRDLMYGPNKGNAFASNVAKTQLGWVVGGCLRDVKGSPKEVACNIATQVQDVDQLVSRFWELDNVADVHPLTEQERYCEEHFKRTYRRDADERKLAKNPTLRDAYSSFIKEYRDLEHMRTLPEDKATPLSTYYIPHHAILNEKSATTKLRVVFDASAKSKSGISLNDALAIGPNIQDDLFSIIARFRAYAYVITADIQKMYRQIRVDESQVSLQKIFWRDDVRNPVSTCELLTLTYGTASASFLATRCLKEIADLEEGNHPIGAQVIRRDFYVDDLLTGADSIAEVREIRDQVNQVLAKAGFKLHKWAANSGKILPHIPEKVDSKQILNLNKEGDIRALGVLWDPSDDSFQYSVPIAAPVHRITKRVILASVAKVFDPLGLIGPVTVTGKVIIQRLWQRGIHWDESIPMDLETAWLHYAKQLPVLNDIRVERKTICKNAKEIEMHGFADASETAVVRYRIAREDDKQADDEHARRIQENMLLVRLHHCIGMDKITIAKLDHVCGQSRGGNSRANTKLEVGTCVFRRKSSGFHIEGGNPNRTVKSGSMVARARNGLRERNGYSARSPTRRITRTSKYECQVHGRDDRPRPEVARVL
ncbi:uncharacterized protein LOC122513575 [Polistes fuscatus]|uniref:uncharacterized protein LOC122513575 n=1 Tax=Polistes fuscatus TaxID=30207 RepID=UPI001CA89D3F|nr:uncharacterized protein LOC122513575 [Polistes fuscatus]